MSQSTHHLRMVPGTWQWIQFTPITCAVYRSKANRAHWKEVEQEVWGWGGMADDKQKNPTTCSSSAFCETVVPVRPCQRGLPITYFPSTACSPTSHCWAACLEFLSASCCYCSLKAEGQYGQWLTVVPLALLLFQCREKKMKMYTLKRNLKLLNDRASKEIQICIPNPAFIQFITPFFSLIVVKCNVLHQRDHQTLQSSWFCSISPAALRQMLQGNSRKILSLK